MVNLDEEISNPPNFCRSTRNNPLFNNYHPSSLVGDDLNTIVTPLTLSEKIPRERDWIEYNKESETPSGRRKKKSRSPGTMKTAENVSSPITLFEGKRKEIDKLATTQYISDFAQLELHILKEERRRNVDQCLDMQISFPTKDLNDILPHSQYVVDNSFEFMESREFSWLVENFYQYRRKYVEMQVFKPLPDRLLINWIQEANNRTTDSGNSDVIPNPIMEVGDNGKPWLKIEAAAMLLHILIHFRPSAKKFPALINCFAGLFLGRILRKDEFPSRKTIMDCVIFLHKLDWKQFCIDFQPKIEKLTPNGFCRLWYSVSDDSKHNKCDRHVVLMSAEDHYDLAVFKLLTASLAVLKDSEGNANLNVEVMREHLTEITTTAGLNFLPDPVDSTETQYTFYNKPHMETRGKLITKRKITC